MIMENSRHCCDDMRAAVSFSCAEHPDRSACPDVLLDYSPRFDEYGLVVHDGGRSSVGIRFCPFCGAALPESKRDRWFEALQARGIDPAGEAIPEHFRNDQWWRDAG
jgi:hypothetical protein